MQTKFRFNTKVEYEEEMSRMLKVVASLRKKGDDDSIDELLNKYTILSDEYIRFCDEDN